MNHLVKWANECQDFFPGFGRYAYWLIKHGKTLPKGRSSVQSLIKLYEMMVRSADRPIMAIIMSQTDCVVVDLSLEPVFATFQEAKQDYKLWTTKQ